VLAFLALFEAGRRVALPSPGYPCYRHILTALGVEHALVETGPSDRWMPTAASLAAQYAATPLAGVLLASPANPTGTMATPERLAEIAAFCRECGLWLVSDEIYHGLDYGVRAETALRYADEAVVINSFSKYYSMTGWRVGWMVVPASLVRPVERLAQNLFISPPAVAQVAAAAAFDALEELEANRQVYAANRDMLLESLPRLGLERFAPPDGAFYVYLDVGHLTDDSQAFAGRLLTEAGVAATPGIDFDPVHGRGYLRLCYAGTPAEVAEALKRLSSWPGLRGRGP
jgi:aspartate/methionine/tyrosine aminotransferase